MVMRRRDFIAALAGAAAWPLVARAQQTKVWRVGYLSGGSATKLAVAMTDAFRIKLQDLGYVEGTNLRFDVRRADDDYTRLPALAAELVSLAPDVIVGVATPATAALQHATSSIPIVMTSASDPVGLGLVKSLATPGANITGLSNLSGDLTAKSLELLHVAIPKAKRIAVLMSLNSSHEMQANEAHTGAGVLGLTIIPVMARTPADLDDAFATMHQGNCDALIVLADTRTTQKIVDLANEWHLPAMYQVSGFVEMGGLLSYATDLTELFRRAAVYVDKILKGASPADLPVEQPTRLELEVNLKTAKTLGLTIPDNILARADKVIE
jgi:putative tryptophan/tyrosine transport system substrate-binding protein